MIFALVQDFADTLAAMPRENSRYRILKLLHEALQRDRQFIARHPTTLFQCLWNSCWWYDCPAAGKHYQPTRNGDPSPPWIESQTKLFQIVEKWEESKQRTAPAPWVRSLRPPADPLDTPLNAVFQNHKAMVNCVTFSPDGLCLAAGSGDRNELDHSVRIVEIASGVELAKFSSQFGMINAIAYSPNGRLLAIAADAGLLCCWNIENGREEWCHRDLRPSMTAVAFHPDGRRFVSGAGGSWFGKDDSVRVWDATTGQELQRIRGHSGAISSVAVTPDGERIVSGSHDKTVRVWDVNSGQQLHCCKHDSLVLSVAVSSDGTRIAVGTSVGKLFIWSANDGNLLHCFAGQSGAINSVTFMESNSSIATASDDSSVRIWDDAGESRTLGSHRDSVLGIAYSPKLHRLVSGSIDRTTRLWDTRDSIARPKLITAGAYVVAACFAPGKNRFATAFANEAYFVLWTIPEFKPLTSASAPLGHREPIRCLAISSQGIIASGSDDHVIRLWTVSLFGNGLMGAGVREGHTGPVTKLEFSPNGKRLVSASQDGTVRIWDVRGGRQHVRSFTGHTRPIESVCFFGESDSELILSRGADGWRLWDAGTGECVHHDANRQAYQMKQSTMANGSRFECREVDFWALETPVIDASAQQPVAWLPSPLLHIEAHPNHPVWWGRPEHGDYFWLFQLEGVDGTFH